MDLDDRKLAILQAVIKNYLETGEPVGSRTISKLPGMSLSSATIRNEMGDLEEMGYLVQPHTSAGRIPSDKGYRLYVDTMMESQTREVENMRKDLIDKADRLETLLQQVANLLAENTNYTTMVTAPQYQHNRIKFIQLSEVDETHMLVVIVMDNNAVKSSVMKLDEPVDKTLMLKLNIMMNSFLAGLDITEINLGVIAGMKEQAGEYVNLVSKLIDTIGKAFADAHTVQIYTSGATNILKYPELTDSGKAGELLDTIEEKKGLRELLQSHIEQEDERGIQVYIGDDTNVESMKDCSVVTATYELEEGVYGKIGIVGPKRMDYAKVVGTLKNLMNQLDDIFKNQGGLESGKTTTHRVRLLDMKDTPEDAGT